MVQISLPQNSKVQKGKYFKDKTGSKNLRKVNVIDGIPRQEITLGLILMRLIWTIVHQKF